LEKAGWLRGPGDAAHHIVASGARRALPARRILARYGVDINSSENGLFMANNVHSRLHTRDYYDAVNSLLLQAQNRQQVLQALSTIRVRLQQSGTYP